MANGLALTRLAGFPRERFPRAAEGVIFSPEKLEELVTEPPEESSYNPLLDKQYVSRLIADGTTTNGVFGTTLHWFQMEDAVRRLRSYLNDESLERPEIFREAFPGLCYIWLRRRDKVAQAISWYKAIMTGRFVKLRSASDDTIACRVSFDFHKIRFYWSALISFDNAWQHYFSSNELKPHIVYYEDICADYTMSLGAVAVFLGLKVGPVVIQDAEYEKLADAQSREWAEEFRLQLKSSVSVDR